MAECFVCGDQNGEGAPLERMICGEHSCCIDCLQVCFQSAMNDESLYPPNCCAICKTLGGIIFDNHPALIDTKVQLYVDYLQKEEEYSIPIRDRIYCAKPNCSAFIHPHSYQGDVGVCSATDCGTHTCTRCRSAITSPTDVHECAQGPSEEDQKFLEFAKEEHYQLCQNCKNMVELAEACNHIICRCGAEWCYICGQPWNPHACPNYGPPVYDDEGFNQDGFHRDAGRNRNGETRLQEFGELPLNGQEDDGEEDDGEEDEEDQAARHRRFLEISNQVQIQWAMEGVDIRDIIARFDMPQGMVDEILMEIGMVLNEHLHMDDGVDHSLHEDEDQMDGNWNTLAEWEEQNGDWNNSNASVDDPDPERFETLSEASYDSSAVNFTAPREPMDNAQPESGVQVDDNTASHDEDSMNQLEAMDSPPDFGSGDLPVTLPEQTSNPAVEEREDMGLPANTQAPGSEDEDDQSQVDYHPVEWEKYSLWRAYIIDLPHVAPFDQVNREGTAFREFLHWERLQVATSPPADEEVDTL